MAKKLLDLPKHERPREKLEAFGATHLKDEELLMVLLGSGIKGKDVRQLAREIISMIDEKGKNRLTLSDFLGIGGIGMAKACHLLAAYEFVSRRVREDGLKITRPADVFPIIRHYGDRKQEHFICVTLNGANAVMEVNVVTIGLLNRTQIHPREVFSDAIKERAAAVILAHNHPSGNLTPSKEDFAATRRLCDAGKLLGISVLDHLIFSSRDYYSLADNNQMDAS